MADGFVGEFLPSLAGLTQGSPISPTLFTVYADGLIRFLHMVCPDVGPKLSNGVRVSALGFADDFKLFAKSPEELTLLLDAFSLGCSAQGMVINENKSEVMVFPHGAAPSDFAPSCQGVPLAVVDTKRCLGVLLSSRLGMGATFPLLRNKMWAAWSAIMRQYGNLQCAPSVGLLLKVLLACVVPTASYACEIWACPSFATRHGSKHQLEADFLYMLKMLLGVRATTPTPVVLRELGVIPLNFQWLKRVATFWNSLQALPPGHLFSVVFRDSCALATEGAASWAGSFVSALRLLQYPSPAALLQALPVDIRALKCLIQDQVQQPWENLHISPRLCPTQGAQLCKYFRWFLPPSAAARTKLLLLRASVSRLRLFHRFRMGVHGLPIDALRMRRPPVPRLHRFCDMCPHDLLGDEHHFVFVCEALAPLRASYSHLFANGGRSLSQFIWQDDLQGVVNFIWDAFVLRASLSHG